jgi:hypothetical protein
MATAGGCAALTPLRDTSLAATGTLSGNRHVGRSRLWPNRAFAFSPTERKPTMGNKIVTEADRKATPRPAAPTGVTITTQRGQKVGLERGSHTRSKKNPGKRAGKGG